MQQERDLLTQHQKLKIYMHFVEVDIKANIRYQRSMGYQRINSFQPRENIEIQWVTKIALRNQLAR